MNASREKYGCDRIDNARADAREARKRFFTTASALQYRLKPRTLANEAWSKFKEKSSALTGDALQVVKDRPLTASSLFAAFILFLAREPLGTLVSDLLGTQDKKNNVEPDVRVKKQGRQVRRAAQQPSVQRAVGRLASKSTKQGVNT